MKNFTSTTMLSVLLMVSACTNIGGQSTLNTTSNPGSFIGSSTTVYSHVVKNASIAALTDGSSNIELSLSTDTSLVGYQSLTQFCGVNSTTIPCNCELKWTEMNTVGGSSSSYERTKRAPLTTVQSGLVKCKFTQSFWSEIPDGTSIKMNIVPVSPTNASGLKAKPITFKKGSSTTPNGDFVDDTLTPFRNIYRYTCYSRRSNTFEILNQFTPTTASSGTNPPTFNVLFASRFCTGDSVSSGSQCATPRNGISSQSYYRNLFVRSDKLGEINSKNSFYECPKVDEAISYSAGQSIPSAEKQKYWPLDTTFAVATSYSPDWSVPIRAGAVLYKSGDPNATNDEGCNTAVDGDSTRYLKEDGMVVKKCLGYAKKPKVNGSCGSITDNNGRVRPLVRLRRYRAIYPPTFKLNGSPDTNYPYADEVYVSDRLVVDTNGVPNGAMIYGPKPCNYSWFDHEGVANTNTAASLARGRYGLPGSSYDFKTNFRGFDGGSLTTTESSMPAYISTSKYEYNNVNENMKFSVNPDGRVLPNIDRDGTIGGLTGPSCSAAISLVDEVMGVPSSVRLVTTNETNSLSLNFGTRKVYLNELHVNPIDPWTPNYVEDTSFQACVPVADPYLEPPMHFYFEKNTNSMAWCSKVYPTQNPYWSDLNAKKRYTTSTLSAKLANYPTAALVKGFTSHVDNPAGTSGSLDGFNSCTGTLNDKVCEASLGSTSHPDYANCVSYLNAGFDKNGAFAHANTCDRTVSFDPTSDNRGFPLLSSDTDIEDMLKNDLSRDKIFGCQYSVHSDPSKINKQMPSSACCGVINGNAVLKNLLTGPASAGAHLEPFLNSSVPNIRFCGNPVE